MGKQTHAPRPAAKPAAGFTQAQATAAAQAGRDTSKTPSVVLDAFTPTPIKVGAIIIPPFKLGKYMLLERINSPLVQDPAPGLAQQPITNEQVLEAVFALATPTSDVLGLLAAGPEVFRKAVWNFADDIDLSQLPALAAAVQTQMQRARATIIGETQSPVSSGEGAAAETAEKKSSQAAVTSPESPPNPTG